MKKKNETRWKFTKKFHADVAKVLKTLFANETYETMMCDQKLSNAVREAGVYCTPNIANKVRTDMGVVGTDQRRIELFARDFKKNKK
jgi:DNA-directed RNA polymerase specialized sigma54-like protein